MRDTDEEERKSISLTTLVADIERVCPGLLDRIARRERLNNWAWRLGLGATLTSLTVIQIG